MKLKKPTSLFKCWLRNRNFTQNTLDTRCQIKSPMWPNRTWRFLGGGKSYRRFTLKSPSTIYPQIACTIYPPLQIVQFWEKFQTHTTSCFASQRSFLRKTNYSRSLVISDDYVVSSSLISVMIVSIRMKLKECPVKSSIYSCVPPYSLFLSRTLHVFDNTTKGQTETTSVTMNGIVICDVKAETWSAVSPWGRTISIKLDVSSCDSKNLQLQQDMWLGAANQEKQSLYLF